MNTIYFHIDVNSAYLSWEAAFRLLNGDALDIRTIPAIIGGDPVKRRGIVLAKSLPAKQFGIRTGESVREALQKCPSLYIATPNHTLYARCSRALQELLQEYSPEIQPFSIDESFMDMSHSQDVIATAYEIKDRVKKELGFTVNIGISTNKLLAKIASDFRKPDRVHTLFPSEIATKMWPLPIRDLFMVGPASEVSLKEMGLRLIGDLAKSDPSLLRAKFKSYGILIHQFANGIEQSGISHTTEFDAKGIGNSTTLPRDLADENTLKMYLLSLCEMVCMRLRAIDKMAYVIQVHCKDTHFRVRSHQRKLLSPLDSTNQIYEIVCQLFFTLWTGYPIRHLGMRVTDLVDNDQFMVDLFQIDQVEKARKLDATVDKLRERFGDTIIQRAVFLHEDIAPMIGGVGEDREKLKLSSEL